jgi:hypothetical protein
VGPTAQATPFTRTVGTGVGPDTFSARWTGTFGLSGGTHWGTGGPGTGVGADLFSTRWTARPTLAAGTYVFTARRCGVRVRVDGTILIDQWRDQSATTYTASRALSAGQHEVRMEYYENGGSAVASLSWAPA